MSKCRYIYDKEFGKVLIPECWAVVNSGDMSRCTCRSYCKTEVQFEREEFNNILSQKNKEIKELEKEVASLNRIIKNLIKRKSQK